MNGERHLDRAPLAVSEHHRLGQGRAAPRQRLQQLEPQHVLGVAQPHHRPPLGRAALLQPQHPGRPRRRVAERQRVARLHLGEVVQAVGIDHEFHRRHAGNDPPADGVGVERVEQHREPPGRDGVVRRAALERHPRLELAEVVLRADDRLGQREHGEPRPRDPGGVPHRHDAGLPGHRRRVAVGLVELPPHPPGGVGERVVRGRRHLQPLPGLHVLERVPRHVTPRSRGGRSCPARTPARRGPTRAA